MATSLASVAVVLPGYASVAVQACRMIGSPAGRKRIGDACGAVVLGGSAVQARSAA